MNYAVIGDPISHSLSPIMHNANFKSLDMQDSYEALHVRKEVFHNIRNIIEDKRIVGFNVTIPHKESIIQYLDEIDDQSKAVGAVNTVKIVDNKWIGYNTDGIGYVSGLKQIYPDLANAYILILGAGGASKGIANELNKIVQPKLTIANRTMSRFESWDMNINAISLNQAEQYLDEFDIIINTTSAGLDNNDDTVIKLDNLSSSTLVSDIIYIPYKTKLLKEAELKGNVIHNGLDMFINQGAESFKIWTGKQPNLKEMKNTVLSKLQGV
ncbi:shikimate dehydrogenase [Staphylococcus haemolyticus]|uniref:shikimate dehydrogenase n=1 Tax=Staphylococcus haemolyticus TaxID=1283 RepID=UPI001F0A2639|nr:shikimate dehydrogenase [Staphylococcus haemolyticus]MCH4459754.1 shikimate dehydrogenase [Staphylococcus haemolyticus]MCH4483190.1 shikimate dehydrogenase [Staphylococcus haemolyticus]MEB5761133.1 shikimate dehydrogenase [Staphylococcus haemolyticus]